MSQQLVTKWTANILALLNYGLKNALKLHGMRRFHAVSEPFRKISMVLCIWFNKSSGTTVLHGHSSHCLCYNVQQASKKLL